MVLIKISPLSPGWKSPPMGQRQGVWWLAEKPSRLLAHSGNQPNILSSLYSRGCSVGCGGARASI